MNLRRASYFCEIFYSLNKLINECTNSFIRQWHRQGGSFFISTDLYCCLIKVQLSSFFCAEVSVSIFSCICFCVKQCKECKCVAQTWTCVLCRMFQAWSWRGYGEPWTQRGDDAYCHAWQVLHSVHHSGPCTCFTDVIWTHAFGGGDDDDLYL